MKKKTKVKDSVPIYEPIVGVASRARTQIRQSIRSSAKLNTKGYQDLVRQHVVWMSHKPECYFGHPITTQNSQGRHRPKN